MIHKKLFQINGPKKPIGGAILIFNKVNFKWKLIRRDRKEHNILIKGNVHQKDIAMPNNYATNIKSPKFINETVLQVKYICLIN